MYHHERYERQSDDHRGRDYSDLNAGQRGRNSEQRREENTRFLVLKEHRGRRSFKEWTTDKIHPEDKQQRDARAEWELQEQHKKQHKEQKEQETRIRAYSQERFADFLNKQRRGEPIRYEDRMWMQDHQKKLDRQPVPRYEGHERSAPSSGGYEGPAPSYEGYEGPAPSYEES